MTTYFGRRLERLEQKLRSRTRRDGTPMQGFEQNVAAIRAELEQINERAAVAAAMKEEISGGE
jgi:hypothetical protein